MSYGRILVASLLLAATAPPAPAGFFSRKPKVNPAERVPELLIHLKTGTDEAQRSAAAEELRQYDPKSYPEIVTGLIDALGRDASPAVRSDAASSLGRLRPISQQAGYALEQAQNNDASVRVRLAARQALWQYHLVGYRGGKPAETPTPAAPAQPVVAAPPGPATQRVPAQVNARPGTRIMGTSRESPEPPLATPPGTVPATPVNRPTASAPARLIPASPRLEPVPVQTNAKVPSNDGPALPPPG
jgi:hypothetical protein